MELLKTKLETPFSTKEVLATAAVGALAFPSVLGAAQVMVFKPLRIVCTGGRLSSVYGGASVCVAGCIASLAAVKTCFFIQERGRLSGQDCEVPRERTISLSFPELLVSTFSSAVVFRALGGRFSSVLPSNLMKAGAFARDWIPAKTPQFATDYEKSLIQSIGKKYGCHSCGKRYVSKFIADHQPPTKLFASGMDRFPYQKFYPQCLKCSTLQGPAVNNGALRSKAIRTHALGLRIYHLFFPITLGISYWKSSRATQGDASTREVLETKEVCKDTSTQTTKLSPSGKSTIRNISDFSELVTNFPLLIIWRRIVDFLESFHNPGDAFHVTLWVFTIVAAFGTI